MLRGRGKGVGKEGAGEEEGEARERRKGSRGQLHVRGGSQGTCWDEPCI